MPTTYAIPNGATQFAINLYTGTGVAQTITNGASTSGTTLQPNLVWIKSRIAARFNNFYDSNRGVGKALYSNATNAEDTGATDCLTAFNSNGFSLGVDASSRGVNVSGDSLVAWQWKAGGVAITNTAGSISSQVSANPTAGFSIVTYTGTGANATVGHGLNVVPSMIIIKNRDSAAIGGAVYHVSTGATKYLQLFQTTTGDAAATTDNTAWNGGSPTFNNNVFSVGALNRTNSAQQMVAYCWSEIAGYSKFGSYTGDTTNLPFVYLGFRPRWVMIKRDATSNWRILDTTRSAFNVESLELYPNLSNAEGTFAAIDGLSNGFKIRNTDASYNATGGTYLYAAFAENPFKYANAR
jgi:hypothetical protein